MIVINNINYTDPANMGID